MEQLVGKSIGNINIIVYETENKMNLFYLQASNKKLIPILDYLDNSLYNYKSN